MAVLTEIYFRNKAQLNDYFRANYTFSLQLFDFLTDSGLIVKVFNIKLRVLFPPCCSVLSTYHEPVIPAG